jgi:hypothetical protein
MGGSDDGARAQGGSGLDPNVVGIDVITSGNTATSLGTIDKCVEVGGVGSTFDIDVFLNDLPCIDVAPADTICDQATRHNLGGVEYRLIYDKTRLKVAATDHNFLMATRGGPPPPGVSDMGDCSPLGSPCPDVDGSLYVSDVGLGVEPAPGEALSGELGAELPGSRGVLTRITLEVVGGAGTFDFLTLTELNFGGYEPGVMPWTGEIDQVWDASHTPRYGIIAIAPASCAAVPSPTPSPTSTPSSTPTTTPPATPTPTPPGPAVAWMYSCYLGASQPTEDALAAISGDVLAAYRLRPDQGYDRWFPASPTVSTMTELNPYDALFLLLATGATWPQQPSGEPPSDANLVFGWNSVCYTGQTKEPESATQGIDGDFAIVYTLAPGQIWQGFVPGRPEASTLTQLDSFTPVLVLVTEEGGALWVFDP